MEHIYLNSVVTEKTVNEIKFLSSAKSAGTKLEFQGKTYTVEEATPESFDGVNIVLASAGGSTSQKFAPEIVKRGGVLIDNSSAFRMEKDVPLVIAYVNDEDLRKHKGIIANPNCSTSQLMLPLKALDNKYKVKRMIVSTYQAVSGAGQKGVEDLENGLKGEAPKKEEVDKCANKEATDSVKRWDWVEARNACAPAECQSGYKLCDGGRDCCKEDAKTETVVEKCDVPEVPLFPVSDSTLSTWGSYLSTGASQKCRAYAVEASKYLSMYKSMKRDSDGAYLEKAMSNLRKCECPNENNTTTETLCSQVPSTNGGETSRNGWKKFIQNHKSDEIYSKCLKNKVEKTLSDYESGACRGNNCIGMSNAVLQKSMVAAKDCVCGGVEDTIKNICREASDAYDWMGSFITVGITGYARECTKFLNDCCSLVGERNCIPIIKELASDKKWIRTHISGSYSSARGCPLAVKKVFMEKGYSISLTDREKIQLACEVAKDEGRISDVYSCGSYLLKYCSEFSSQCAEIFIDNYDFCTTKGTKFVKCPFYNEYDGNVIIPKNAKTYDERPSMYY